MCSVVVVEVKIRRQQTSTMVRGRVSEAVSPFAEQSLNHSLRLAVGPRSVWSGANVLDAELLARCGEESRAIGIAVVGQKASNQDATLGEPSDSSTKEGDRRPLSFVAEYFHVCQSRSVINANMNELPAGSRSMSPIAGDPMPDPVDPSELLHIDVQQISRTTPFVSPRRWPRLKTAQTRQTCSADDSSNRGAAEAHRLPNLPARQSLATQRSRSILRPPRAGPAVLDSRGNFAHSCECPSRLLLCDLFVGRLSGSPKPPGWTIPFREQRVETSQLVLLAAVACRIH